jgi:hypothetical protein
MIGRDKQNHLEARAGGLDTEDWLARGDNRAGASFYFGDMAVYWADQFVSYCISTVSSSTVRRAALTTILLPKDFLITTTGQDDFLGIKTQQIAACSANLLLGGANYGCQPYRRRRNRHAQRPDPGAK